jgi:hypothetical protein
VSTFRRTAAFVGLFAGLCYSCTSGVPPAAHRPGARQAELREVGLSVQQPGGWKLYKLDDDLGPYNQIALITSNRAFDVDARSTQYPALWDMSQQPDDLVAVILSNVPPAQPCQPKEPDTRLPLSRHRVTESSAWLEDYPWQENGRLYAWGIDVDGQVLQALLWVGRQASESDANRGLTAVRSIRRIEGWSIDCRSVWGPGWSRRA